VFIPLDDTNAVGNIKSIVILAEADVALFQSSGSDQCVDLFTFNIVKLSYSILDLSLVGLDVNNENKCIAIFNQLHGRFSCERVFDNSVLVQSALFGDTSILVLRLTTVLKRHWPVEMNLGVDTGALFGHTLLKGLAHSFCFAC